MGRENFLFAGYLVGELGSAFLLHSSISNCLYPYAVQVNRVEKRWAFSKDFCELLYYIVFRLSC